jgi:isoleucyl-tRNA synthetase
MGHDYKSTLNLLGTLFPMRADAIKNDPLMQDRWKALNLDSLLKELNNGNESFVLHDGPPYANGDIHLGHAYNKVMKDIFARFKRMAGYHVNIIPGWDCHGLPIEQKVSSENPQLKGAELKKACRKYAFKWVQKQREDFKKLGISMDWENPYLTMSPVYEGKTVEAFGKLYETGFIHRTNKTIPWCMECQTALASAEIEYHDRKDPSVYVKFLIKDSKNFFKVEQDVSFLVWTTTPWTLPLNRGLMLKEKGTYELLKSENDFLIVGSGTVEHLKNVCNKDFISIKTFSAEEFKELEIHHPFEKTRLIKIIFDNEVSTTEGTACVHTAPGCGPIDYEIGIKNGLEIYSPITSDGRYSEDVLISELKGMSIKDAQGLVIQRLEEENRLFFKTTLMHSYPFCWRSKTPLIFRATPQWFFNLENNDLKKRAKEFIQQIEFHPAAQKRFLDATVSSRWEWCLSRQRVWGAPIIALIHKNNKDFYTSVEFIQKVSDEIKTQGIEFWDVITIEELLARGFLPKDFPINNYVKENNILDVWFDSGVSNYACLSERLVFPADLYLEGIDQHRGWFQSSLLLSTALHNKAPMKHIMTHGFTVDEKGQKMSKSIGNTVAPFELTQKIGTDGLRLWVAFIGNEGDAVVSDQLINNISDVYRKIRNTCRFMLQNISDFKFSDDLLENKSILHAFDVYVLYRAYEVYLMSVKHYNDYNLTGVIHIVSEFCSSFLSAMYFDSLKDTLYCDKIDNLRRRSSQLTMYLVLDMINTIMAPILVHTSDFAFDYYKNNGEKSIHLQLFKFGESIKKLLKNIIKEEDLLVQKNGLLSNESIKNAHLKFMETLNKEYMQVWKSFWLMRDKVMQHIEQQRAAKLFSHSSEAFIHIYIGKEDHLWWNAFKYYFRSPEELTLFLRDIFVVSEVFLDNGLEEQSIITVRKYEAIKCPRCWKFYKNIHELCSRCESIIKINN